MQTAAIPYRVADFLKQHPPFQGMDETDLVSLAGRGRVKFHEPDEYICWQASPHTPFIYVIQQGSVSLWDETVNPPTLRDIRGPGDSIGIERFNGSPTSLHSAKAASEVVLYALQAADFEQLLARYPHAAQYIAAYAAVTADYKAPGERPHPHEIFLADLVRDRAPIHCLESATIRDAARLLSESGAQALALTKDCELSALLTPADLIQWIAAGAPNPEQPARSIASTVPITVAPQTLVSDCVLAMAESRSSAAALTSDGTPRTALQSIVTASCLAPAFGDHPITILQEIGSARGVESLRVLNERARAWILDHLTASSALDWLASFADLVNRRILERVVAFTGNDGPDNLWFFYGAAGRQELLTSETPRIALIGTASASLEAALADCGYLSSEPVAAASLDEWKTRFSGWIRDPILTGVYDARPFSIYARFMDRRTCLASLNRISAPSLRPSLHSFASWPTIAWSIFHRSRSSAIWLSKSPARRPRRSGLKVVHSSLWPTSAAFSVWLAALHSAAPPACVSIRPAAVCLPTNRSSARRRKPRE